MAWLTAHKQDKGVALSMKAEMSDIAVSTAGAISMPVP
jgi:hypothetical protein